jgi:hypothetical protein
LIAKPKMCCNVTASLDYPQEDKKKEKGRLYLYLGVMNGYINAVLSFFLASYLFKKIIFH